LGEGEEREKREDKEEKMFFHGGIVA
jgi:hypothetical protein